MLQRTTAPDDVLPRMFETRDGRTKGPLEAKALAGRIAGQRDGEPARPREGLPGDLLCLALAHELKNDLHAMSGFFELIRGASEDRAKVSHLALRGFDLAQGAGRLMRLVAGAMLEESDAVLAGESERIEHVARRAVETVQLRMGIDAAPGLWVGRSGESRAKTNRPFLLEIVLTNLIHNAVLSTPVGAEPPKVTVEDQAEGQWRVTVADHAGGLPDGARRVLLGEPGAVTEVDLDGRSGRWGLGLLLVRASSLAGGWTIAVSAVSGHEGTSIQIRGSSRAPAATRPTR